MADPFLSDEDIYALNTLVYSKSRIVIWDNANYVGHCHRGHLIVSAGIIGGRCLEAVSLPGGRVVSCGEDYRPLPHQDALLAAYRMGGWDALVQAAQGMIGSHKQGG